MRQQQLKSLRQAIQAEINGIREALERWKTHNGGQSPADADEIAASGASYLSWKRRMDHRLVELSLALSRMDGDDYGYCEDCGEEIPYQRLEAVPSTPYCIACMRRREGSPQPIASGG